MKKPNSLLSKVGIYLSRYIKVSFVYLQHEFVAEISTNSKPSPRLVTVVVDAIRDPIPTWDIPPSGR